MTKNQIIAKALLCGVGFYSIGYCLSLFMMTWGIRDNSWDTVVNLLVYSAVFFIVCRVLIFNSDKLAGKISGSYSEQEDFDRRAYLVKSFRIAFAAVGLSLLCSPRFILVILRIVKSFSLPKIRLWFRSLIQTGDFDMPVLSLVWMVSLLKILLASYLIFGGAFIINWHLKRSGLTIQKGAFK